VFHPPGRMRLNTGIQSTPPTEEHSAYWTTIHAPPLSLFVLFCYATLKGSVQRPISEQGRLFLFSLYFSQSYQSIPRSLATWQYMTRQVLTLHPIMDCACLTVNVLSSSSPSRISPFAINERGKLHVLQATDAHGSLLVHVLRPPARSASIFTFLYQPLPLSPSSTTLMAEIHGTMAFSWRRLGFPDSFSS